MELNNGLSSAAKLIASPESSISKSAPVGVLCFKCGNPGHKSIVCPTEVKRCSRCRKIGHAITECKHKEMICLSYSEGHFGSQGQNI